MKILIFSFSHIGDVVLSTSLIPPLRRRFKGCEIAFLVGPAAKGIIAEDPSIDRVIIYDNLGVHKGLAGKFRLVRSLRQERFDLIVDLRDSFWSRWSGSKRWGLRIRGKPIHAVVRYLDILKAHGISTEGGTPSLSLSEFELKFANDFLKGRGFRTDDLLIGIHPGGGWKYKLWSQEKFAQLADAIVEKFKAKVLLFSAPKEAELTENIRNLMSYQPILAENISLRHLAALIKQCRLYIGNDSGPMHIATAVKTPAISLFGSTDPRRSSPYGDHNRVILSGIKLGCNPCHPGKNPGGCHAKSCKVIDDISVAQVINAVKAELYP